jgi:hypothetical protein
MCDDDKYAMTVSLQESNLLRFDLAGEKLVINVDPVIRVADYAVSNSKRYFESIMKTVKAKLGK